MEALLLCIARLALMPDRQDKYDIQLPRSQQFAMDTPSFPKSRHRLADFSAVRAQTVLGGLHHEYSLAPA